LDGDPALISVSTNSWINVSAYFPKVLGFEILLCAVEQNPKVFAIDPKFAANLLAIALVKEYSFQERSISGGHTEQDLSNLDLDLTGNGDCMRVCSGGCRFHCTFLVEGFASGGCAVVLEEDVVADRVYEGTEAFRLAQGAGLSEAGKDPRERFLTHVLDRLRGLEPRAKLQMEQFSEVAYEMLLGAEVPSAEIFDVRRVKRVKLQGRPRKAWRT